MYCHKCGNKLPNDAVFCNGCGSRVALNAQETPAPSPSGRVTIQFEASTPLPPTQLDSSPSHPPTQFGSSPLYPPTQFGSSPSYPPVWQTSTLPQTQQARMSPTNTNPNLLLLPSNKVQQTLLRIFGPNLAVNAVFGIVLGGVFAVGVGVLATALLLNIAHAIAPHITNSNGYTASGEEIVDYALGIIPLHNLWRDTLQLLLIMHGAGIHRQYGNTSYMALAPLYGLLVLPALLLTLGGYIAASTDFQNRMQSSLLRGVAIALPYTLLLLLLATQVNGCIPEGIAGICSDVSASSSGTLSVDTLTLVIFGLLWGSLFGLLGASLKIARGQWRQMMRHYLRTSSRPQIMGMIVGGLAASGLGIALALLVFFSFMVYTSYSLPLLARSVCLPSADWQTLTLWNITEGPLHAMNVLLMSFGAPITINNPQQSPCFYTSSVHTSISLFGSGIQLASWTHLLLALPVISLFLGGRVSVAMSRVQGTGPGAIQGALIALPFTVLMILLAIISTITFTYSSAGSTTSGLATYVQAAGVGAFDLLLWALLCGAVFGALGGMYQASSMKNGVSQFLVAFALPLVMLSKPGYTLLDRLTGQPRGVQQSRGRSFLYGAVLCTLLLAIVAGIAGGALIGFNQFFTLDINVHVRDSVAVVVVALPGLLLVCACGAALCSEPVPESNNNEYAPALRW